ncbi:MAG: hypothetical protein RR140_02615 [Clostridia bacterium]
MNRKIDLPVELVLLGETLLHHAELFVVGGFVRDSLLEKKNTDIDICSKLTPSELFSILKNTQFEVIDKNSKLGCVVVKVGKYAFEHTTFRKEIYFSNGTHLPEAIEFCTDIREDAKRRDFTINAIYYNVLSNEMIDIYSGLGDLKRNVVRTIETPSYVFQHDGLRILRFARIVAQTGFKADFVSFTQAKKMAYRLTDISGKRKFQELQKILELSLNNENKKSNSYLVGLKMLNCFKVWPTFYIPVSHIKFKMTKRVEPSQKLLGFLIDVIDCVNPDCVEYYLKQLLGNKGFMLKEKEIDRLNMLVCGYFDALNKKRNKDYFIKYCEYYPEIAKILKKRSNLLFDKYNFFWEYAIAHKLPLTIKDLKITSLDLKKHFPKIPEKKYQKIMKKLLNQVFEGEIINSQEKLLMEVRDAFNNGDY